MIEDIPEISEQATIIPFAAVAGYNIATITGVLSTPIQAWVWYGTATGVYTLRTPPQNGIKTFNPDGTLKGYLYTFTIRNVQLPANQAYFATVYLQDGTSTSELTWTQPGLNPNAADQVLIMNKAKRQLSRITDIATRASRRGWLSNSEWVGLKRALAIVQEYNRIKWNDGR